MSRTWWALAPVLYAVRYRHSEPREVGCQRYPRGTDSFLRSIEEERSITNRRQGDGGNRTRSEGLPLSAHGGKCPEFQAY